MTLPLVSYLVPSYNHAPYVRQCLASIRSQDYPAIEIIVCDDSSTDGTYELLQSLQAEFDFVLLRNECNAGPSASLNRMLALARGVYFGILASDDWIEPHKTRYQVEALQRTGQDAYLGSIRAYDQDTGQYTLIDRTKLMPIFAGGRYLEHLYQTDAYGAPTQSGLFRTEAARGVGFLPQYRSDDWLFVIRFLQAGYTIGFEHTHLTNWRIHSSNSHSRPDYVLNQIHLPVIRDFIPPRYKRVMCATAYHWAAIGYSKQQPWRGLAFAVRSFANRPDFGRFRDFSKCFLLGFKPVAALYLAGKGRFYKRGISAS